MGARASTQKRIDKLQAELADLHGEWSAVYGEIEKHEFAIQELQALLKTLPEDDDSENGPAEISLRKGSDAARSRDALRKVHAALHVDDLLREIGKPVEKKSRVSLAGQLSLYVRKGQIFTRPEPNTFGLKEWDLKPGEPSVIGSPMHEHFKIKIPGVALSLDDEDSEALLPKDEPETSEQAH
jgi:hypothetical protein